MSFVPRSPIDDPTVTDSGTVTLVLMIVLGSLLVLGCLASFCIVCCSSKAPHHQKKKEQDELEHDGADHRQQRSHRDPYAVNVPEKYRSGQEEEHNTSTQEDGSPRGTHVHAEHTSGTCGQEEEAQKYFTLHMCAEAGSGGEKRNIEVKFERKPDSVAKVRDEGEMIFRQEVALKAEDPKAFAVVRIVFYDDITDLWKPLENIDNLTDYAQIYLLQADADFDERTRDIPPPTSQVIASRPGDNPGTPEVRESRNQEQHEEVEAAEEHQDQADDNPSTIDMRESKKREGTEEEEEEEEEAEEDQADDWIVDEESGFLWSESQGYYYDEETCMYGDPDTGEWFE